jgi:uncharacterized protein YigA (DUF484 family)
MSNRIQAEDVANYFNQNREFFHVFPDLLDNLSIPHPKTGKAISLLEHQVFQLREQRDRLQIEIDALKDMAGENGELLRKVYQLSNYLLAAETEQEAVNVIYETMENLFEVEYIALVSWDVPKQNVNGITQLGLSQGWVSTLKSALVPKKPACGLLENEWQNGLFHTKDKMESVCLLPLGDHKIWGVLALGATSNRFTPDLGTYFLEMMADMVTERFKRLFK